MIPDGVVADKLTGGLSDEVLCQKLPEYVGEHYTPLTNLAHGEDPVLGEVDTSGSTGLAKSYS